MTLALSFSIMMHTSSLAADSSETPKESSIQGFIEYCETAMCRKNLTVKLKQNDWQYYERTFELLPPAVQGEMINIYAGEKIFIEADFNADQPENFKQVLENKNPEKTIVFDLKQATDTGDGIGMMLTVSNPFSRPLHYKMGMMPLDKEDLYKTSSCPVIAGGSIYEHWPHPIFQIVIARLYFLKDGDQLECR